LSLRRASGVPSPARWPNGVADHEAVSPAQNPLGWSGSNPGNLLANIAWDGGATGNGASWLDPLNWAGDVLPGAADVAILGPTGTSPLVTIAGTVSVQSIQSTRAIQLNSGTTSVSAASQLTGLTLSGNGVLGGAGDVTVTGVLSWTGGTMQGGARTTVAPGGTLSMGTATGTKVLSRTLENDGSATWSDGQIQMNGGTIQNDGTFTASSGTTLQSFGLGGTNAFVNNGTFIKQGTGQVQFLVSTTGVAFNNTGTVDVQQGTLAINAGSSNFSAGTLSGGTWIVSAGAITSTFGSITTNAANIELHGTGMWSAISTLAVNNGSLILASGRDLSLTPARGTLTNNSTLALGPGSTLAITGGFAAAPGSSLSTTLAGTDPATQFGRITATAAATLGGTLSASLQAPYIPAIGAGFDVVTAASRSGTFSTLILPAPATRQSYYAVYSATQARLENDHAIGVWTGLGNGAAWSDTANWARNALPGVSDDAYISVPASPTVTLGASAQSVRSLFTDEAILLDGGSSLTLAASSSFNSGLSINGGSLSIGAPTTLGGTSVLNAGSIAGSGNLNVGGTLDWQAGSIGGAGTLTVEAGGVLTVSGVASKALDRTLTNSGSLTWTGGDLATGTGGINNLGTFDFSSSGVLSGSGTLVNNGSLTKSGNGPSTLALGVDQRGLFEIDQGEARLTGGGIWSGNSLTGGAGNTLRLGGTLLLESTAQISGLGLVVIGSGQTTLEGQMALDGDLRIDTGATLIASRDASVGHLQNDGSLNLGVHHMGASDGFGQSGTGTLTLRAESLVSHGRITTGGPAELDGALSITFGTSFRSRDTDSMQLIQSTAGTTGTFANATAGSLGSNRRVAFTYTPAGLQLFIFAVFADTNE